MKREAIEYEFGGAAMRGQLFRPSGASAQSPSVLVFPEAFGLTAHAISRAEGLAEAGYIALACDLHGHAKIINDREERRAAAGPMLADAQLVRAYARNALETLQMQVGVDRERIAAIGFCLGGSIALELAFSGAEIKAAIGFHCGLSIVTASDSHAVRGKLLVCIGDEDPSISPSDRAAFEAALRNSGVDWQMHVYGGVVHAFTNPAADSLGLPDFARYDANADTRSWSSMMATLEAAM